MKKIFLSNHKPFEKNFGIRFEEPEIKIHRNGFISVTVDWKSRKNTVDFWRFKYPELQHTMYGGDALYKRKRYFINTAVAFSFPNLDEDQPIPIDFKELKMTSWFDICLGVKTEEDFGKDPYEYLFFEKTKYGLICWFGPKGWEDWDNAKDFEN
jgi:hypothetical protein